MPASTHVCAYTFYRKKYIALNNLKLVLNMRKRKMKFCVVLLLGIGLVGVQAQSILNVKVGSENFTHEINGIRKLTFTGDNLNVITWDASTSNFALANIDKLFFSDTPTNMPPKGAALNQIELFPNPVQDILNIKNNTSDNCNCIVEILDLKGTILQKEDLGAINSINVSVLQKGMYICRVYYCDKIENLKFIKN